MIALMCALTLTLGGCAKQKNDVSESKIKVGVVLKTLSSEYWNYVEQGVKAAAEDLDVEVDVQGAQSETAYDEHNNMIETLLSSRNLDAIVISPSQPDSVSSVLGNTSCPVLFVDTDADYDKKITYIGTGNYEGAYKGAEYAASIAKKGAKAILIGGTQGNTTTDDRMNGFRDALKKADVEIISEQYADGLADKAANIMENLLTRIDNDVDIVMCNNDEIASGVSRTLKQAGLNDVIIAGFDGIQSGVQNVIDGNVTITVAQSPFKMGYTAVEAAVATVKGEKVESRIDTGITLVTSENANEYLNQLKEQLKNE